SLKAFAVVDAKLGDQAVRILESELNGGVGKGVGAGISPRLAGPGDATRCVPHPCRETGAASILGVDPAAGHDRAAPSLFDSQAHLDVGGGAPWYIEGSL